MLFFVLVKRCLFVISFWYVKFIVFCDICNCWVRVCEEGSFCLLCNMLLVIVFMIFLCNCFWKLIVSCLLSLSVVILSVVVLLDCFVIIGYLFKRVVYVSGKVIFWKDFSG